MKAIWKGALSFGLINIPIHVYVASEEHALEFDMLHKKDLSPIRYARICKLEEKEIPYNEVVKGYEYEKGEYVVVEDKDFKKANIKKTSTIEIQNFVKADEIDPLYFAKPYYLEPDKKAAKAYAILSAALKKAKRVAIVTFVFRNKEHIGMVQPMGNMLLLVQLRYLSEIRDYKDLELPKVSATTQEVEMAVKLVNELSATFEPKKYKDTYTAELKSTIQGKLKKKKPTRKVKQPVAQPQVTNLMKLLKESLEKEKKVPLHPKKTPIRRKHA